MVNPIKQIIDKYEICDKIEGGNYGNVYKAYDITNNEKYAIKVSLNKNKTNILINEYNILKNLSHKNIIKCFSYYEKYDKANGYQAFLIMERGDIDFFEYIVNNRYDIYLVINYIYDTICGIEYLHKNNIVHGDIKLENVILKDNYAKIIDMGFSKKLKLDKYLYIDYFQGTKNMIAPELLRYNIVGLENDIWSLGKMIQIINSEIKRHGIIKTSIFKNIYNSCLTFNYKKRPNITEIKKKYVDLFDKFIDYRVNLEQPTEPKKTIL